MLQTSSPAAVSLVRQNVFQRAALRMGISRGGEAAPPRAVPTPQGLLERFHALKGGEKTAFFRANKAKLMAAEAAAPLQSPAASRPKQPLPPARPAAARAMPNSTETPEALLERFHAMTGPGKTAFFRANKPLLKAAAACVELRESAPGPMNAGLGRLEASGVRNFAVAQAEAVPPVSGASLLEKFQMLSGTAKTAFFRANHTALKIAAAN